MSASSTPPAKNDLPYKTMEVRAIAGALGAEIYGVDLKDRANKSMWAELHRAFLEHQVIAVRGQDLSPEDQMNVGRFFGEPCFYPFAKGMDGYAACRGRSCNTYKSTAMPVRATGISEP